MAYIPLFNADDKARLDAIQKQNNIYADFFDGKRKEIESMVKPLFEVLGSDMGNPSNAKRILEIQALALTYKHTFNDQISIFMNKRSVEKVNTTQAKADKFLFYATGFDLKTNLSEKTILIDAHLSERERTLELIEAYITFLRDTVKNLESLGYAIKNMIELYSYLGK